MSENRQPPALIVSIEFERGEPRYRWADADNPTDRERLIDWLIQPRVRGRILDGIAYALDLLEESRAA